MEISSEIIVSIASLIGTILAVLGGNKLVAYRIEQLERKVEKHNTIIERTFVLEEQMKVANHRITDLERMNEHGQQT